MAITPATYNIRPQRRADYPLQVQFKDGNNVGINITGWTVVAQVWDKDRVTKYGDFTVTVEDALIGKVMLMLPYTVTTGLPDEPGKGMWQLGVRYDSADLNDGNVNFANPLAPVVTGVMGGEESNWTIGVNWYLRSNFKLSANYVMVDSSRYSSTIKGFQDDNPNILSLRAQFYW